MRVTLAGMFLALVLALVPGPAHAHKFKIWHGYDTGIVNSDHTLLIIRDRECDGNRVYGTVTYGGWRITDWDRNGCEPGGTRFKLGPQATSVRIGEYFSTGSPENSFFSWGAWWPV